MSHEAIFKHRQNSPAECRIRLAGEGLAVLSRNIQKLGTIKRDRERQRLLIEKQKLAA